MLSHLCRTFSTLILASFLTNSAALAQVFKVEKVKGNKAMIEFSGSELSPGKTYSYGGAETSGEVATVAGPRKYIIGGSMDLEFFTLTSSTTGTTSENKLIQIISRFGWNLETSEIGFSLDYANQTPISASNSFVKGGLFYDYNFSPNRPGEKSIFGIGANLTYGTFTSSAGGSVAEAYVSGFWKWFTLGPSTALRFDLGYDYQAGTFSTFTTKNQGLALRGGLATYF